jgi:hypothetical protein
MQQLEPFHREGGMTTQKRHLIAVCQNQQEPWHFRNAIYLLSAKANPTRSPVRTTAFTSASNSRVLKSTNCSNTIKVSLHDQYQNLNPGYADITKNDTAIHTTATTNSMNAASCIMRLIMFTNHKSLKSLFSICFISCAKTATIFLSNNPRDTAFFEQRPYLRAELPRRSSCQSQCSVV